MYTPFLVFAIVATIIDLAFTEYGIRKYNGIELNGLLGQTTVQRVATSAVILFICFLFTNQLTVVWKSVYWSLIGLFHIAAAGWNAWQIKKAQGGG
jgi:hypothetical protein